jgi:hypothetical protein
MSTKEREGLAPAPADSSQDTPRRARVVSARRIRAGELLLSGEVKSTGRALIRAGYAEGTARNPRANRLDATSVIRDALTARGRSDPKLRDLREPALRTLRAGLEDEGETSLPQRAALAGVVLKLIGELPEEPEDPGQRDRWALVADLRRSRTALAAVRLTRRSSPEHAESVILRRLGRLRDRLAELEALEAAGSYTARRRG